MALLGARQVGKTTIARQITERKTGVTYFDLENPRDLARLADPMLALENLEGLVVIDEIQKQIDLFPILRVLVDRPDELTRYLVLGSASPQLVQQGSETLAGRIGFHELEGFALDEIGFEQWRTLWLRGGFPRSFLADSDAASAEWRLDFIANFVERDLGKLGLPIPATTIRNFWNMLAHYHGQTLNASELGRAFGASDKTVRSYAEALVSTFVIRLLQPWHENLKKRQVKTPKVYLRDSGLLHTLLDVETTEQLEGHPKVGASWEGFALNAVTTRLGARSDQCYFWATHSGAELDLLVTAGKRRLGFEFKRTSAPRRTRSMTVAISDLGLERIDVVYPGSESFPLGDRIRAVGLECLKKDLQPLR